MEQEKLKTLQDFLSEGKTESDRPEDYGCRGHCIG